MPIHMPSWLRGFANPFRVEYQVNVGRLQELFPKVER